MDKFLSRAGDDNVASERQNDIGAYLLSELQQKDNVLRRFLQSLSGGVIIFDHLGNIVFINDYMYARQYIADDVRAGQATLDNLNFQNLCDAETMQILRHGVQRIYQSGEVCFGDFRCLRDKQYINGVAHIYPVFDDMHEIAAVLLFVVEMPDSQPLDNCSVGRDEMLHNAGVMAVGVIHEAKNPLQSISSLAQSIQLAHADLPDVVSYSSAIVEQVDNVASLLSEFLSVVNFRHHSKEYVDLNEICRKVALLVRSNGHMRGIEIIEEYDDELPRILSNASRLRQILVNLLANALDAACHGGHIYIKTLFDVQQNAAILEIADDGCGMDEITLQNYARPFYTTKKNGTGMGLPICCDIAAELGGSLKIFSKAGEGTRVLVILP